MFLSMQHSLSPTARQAQRRWLSSQEGSSVGERGQSHTRFYSGAHTECTTISLKLQSLDATEVSSALSQLSTLIGEAFGAVGERLGCDVRESGCLPLLCGLIAGEGSAAAVVAESPALVTEALWALANLSSDTVDAQSTLTKHALLECRAPHTLLARLSMSLTRVIDTTQEQQEPQELQELQLTCAALQNLSAARDWAQVLIDVRAEHQLEELIGHSNAQVRRYASGALSNLLQRRDPNSKLGQNLSGSTLQAVQQRQTAHSSDHSTRMQAASRIAASMRRRAGGTHLTEAALTVEQAQVAVLGPTHSNRDSPYAKPSAACNRRINTARGGIDENMRETKEVQRGSCKRLLSGARSLPSSKRGTQERKR